MRSRQLHTAIAEYAQAAASHLRAEVAAGAEVPFELGSTVGRGRGVGATPLYCYRALTGPFIAEREAALKRLPGHAEAAKVLEGFDGLDRYLAATGADVSRLRGRARVRIALKALLEDVFDEQTDFQLRPERLRLAIERLERSASASTGRLELVTTLHGLALSSREVVLAKGLTIAHPDAFDGIPPATASDEESCAQGHLLVIHALEEDDLRKGIADGRGVLLDLLRALRLFADGRVFMGALAWARMGAGGWQPLALTAGGAPAGVIVVPAAQEDELRAFCSLVSRRAPRGNELEWALRRFELGCERENACEALTDHLLALRALLEPEGPESGLLAGRLAALCATPERRHALAERVARAVALERRLITGASAKQVAAARALAEDAAGHLRALLSDVICGHLDPDLVALADELLVAPEGEGDAEPPPDADAGQDPAPATADAPEAGEAAAPEPAGEEASAAQTGKAGTAEEALS